MTLYRDYDQAGLDAQYDNRAMVPTFPDHLAAWKSESDAARAALPHRLDLAYGTHERERLDLFPAGPKAPLHLFVHGGYWRAMDKHDFAFPAPGFVEAGIAYGAIGYPLAPEVTVAAIADSIARALDWVFDHTAEFGVDPEKIVLSGHSAGGHLAAMTRADPALGPRLRGVLAISGLYDLEPIRLCYLNADLHLDPEGARRAGPIHRALPAGGPVVLAVGAEESDEYHRQQDVFAARLKSAGTAVGTLDLAGQDHFSILQTLARPGGALFATVEGLIRG